MGTTTTSTGALVPRVPRRYVSRTDFILERCVGKSVLHLGCSSGEALRHWLGTGKEAILHLRLAEVAEELYGVDIHEPSLQVLRELGVQNLYLGDVEALDSLPITRRFDVVLAADLVEHLSNPGRMLGGIHRFLQREGELVLSTPNAFGLPNALRYFLRRFQDGPGHVAMFNSDNLVNLLSRYNYRTVDICSAFDRLPWNRAKKLEFLIGAWFLRLKPENGGTLIVVATSERE